MVCGASTERGAQEQRGRRGEGVRRYPRPTEDASGTLPLCNCLSFGFSCFISSALLALLALFALLDSQSTLNNSNKQVKHPCIRLSNILPSSQRCDWQLNTPTPSPNSPAPSPTGSKLMRLPTKKSSAARMTMQTTLKTVDKQPPITFVKESLQRVSCSSPSSSTVD